MSWRELFKEIASTGPDNFKKLLDVAERLPSDETLRGLISTVNNLTPLIPQIERIFGDGNIKNLEGLMKKIPDQKTLNRLADALPMLEKLPDKETLTQLLNKAESLTGFLDSLDSK